MYKYRLLPSGNAEDCKRVESFIKEKGIKVEVCRLSTGYVYRVELEEVKKFPKDKNGHYFGTTEWGWSFLDYDFQDIILKSLDAKWEMV